MYSFLIPFRQSQRIGNRGEKSTDSSEAQLEAFFANVINLPGIARSEISNSEVPTDAGHWGDTSMTSDATTDAPANEHQQAMRERRHAMGKLRSSLKLTLKFQLKNAEMSASMSLRFSEKTKILRFSNGCTNF